MTRMPKHVLKLLSMVAAYDRGDGVTFRAIPRGRWRLAEHPRGYAVKARTFYPLTARGLVEVSGDDPLAVPVTITDAGRAYLGDAA
ncbi:hypothetical protein [Streptomyces himalayensis]|uniref:Uncharacterized protein n=1 Tax=Streptomyces himalayensis subsp. himalayensis TaxID=2756131 RepID=A0A7W0DT85_9ACTN|nr:hypothetical protein [Streptomyces himalayensis]MBA2950338.1 hypothetical protein [Streptomyces himalayensis subsp. himalayensis]